MNLEEVAKLQPDFLVFAESQPGNASREVEKLATLPGWKIVRAVRDRRYAVINDAVNRPAPRIVSAIEELARQLHSQAFGEKAGDTKKEKKENPRPPSLAFAPFSWNSPQWPLGHPRPTGGCLCGR